MRIVLLVKHVPDTEEPRFLDTDTGLMDRSGECGLDEINSRALTWALELRRQTRGEITVVTMGPDAATKALRQALAIGADKSVHISDDALAGSDALQTSAVLAAALQRIGFDLVVAGDAATDGRGGIVPAMIAERLGVPHLTHASSATLAGDELTTTRDDGDTVATVTAGLPAVLSLRETIAEPEVPGFRGIMGAKRKPRQEVGLTELGVATHTPVWTTTSVVPRPARSQGQLITNDDGTAARQIADYLASQQLIGK